MDGRLNKSGHCPFSAACAAPSEEVRQYRTPVLGVNNFGMELEPPDAALRIGGGGDNIPGHRENPEARGQCLDPIPVTHPDLETLGQTTEQIITPEDFSGCLAEFPLIPRTDLASKRLRDQL